MYAIRSYYVSLEAFARGGAEVDRSRAAERVHLERRATDESAHRGRLVLEQLRRDREAAMRRPRRVLRCEALGVLVDGGADRLGIVDHDEGLGQRVGERRGGVVV